MRTRCTVWLRWHECRRATGIAQGCSHEPAATKPMRAQSASRGITSMKAIAIIQDEHRSITAVVEGLRHVLAEVDAGRGADSPARGDVPLHRGLSRAAASSEGGRLPLRAAETVSPGRGAVARRLAPPSTSKGRPTLRRAQGGAGGLSAGPRAPSDRSASASSATRISTGGTCVARKTTFCRSPP